MALNAQAYYNCLKAYLNLKNYAVTQSTNGKIVITEKIYPKGSAVLTDQKIILNFRGEAFVIKLDRYDNMPLFHFLNNDSKPWAKRCDFVIFHRNRNKVNAHCIEFKSGTFPEKLVDQLKASLAWCHSLHSTIKHYTTHSRKMSIRKFVFSCHSNPEAYLDAENKYLTKDHSIRHYLYSDIDGTDLEDIENDNMVEIR